MSDYWTTAPGGVDEANTAIDALDEDPTAHEAVTVSLAHKTKSLLASLIQRVRALEEGGGGPGGGFLHQTNVELTNAQVIALNSSAVQVLASPGPGLAVIMLAAVLRLEWTANYENIDPASLIAIEAGSTPVLDRLSEARAAGVSGLLAASESSAVVLQGRQITDGTTSFGASGVVDFDIVDSTWFLTCANGSSSDFEGGDPANVLRVTVTYLIYDVDTGEFV